MATSELFETIKALDTYGNRKQGLYSLSGKTSYRDL